MGGRDEQSAQQHDNKTVTSVSYAEGAHGVPWEGGRSMMRTTYTKTRRPKNNGRTETMDRKAHTTSHEHFDIPLGSHRALTASGVQ